MIIRVFPSLDRDKTKSWEGYDPVVVKLVDYCIMGYNLGLFRYESS